MLWLLGTSEQLVFPAPAEFGNEDRLMISEEIFWGGTDDVNGWLKAGESGVDREFYECFV